MSLKVSPNENSYQLGSCNSFEISGVPYGSRTRVAAVKGRCPRPLDERDVRWLSNAKRGSREASAKTSVEHLGFMFA